MDTEKLVEGRDSHTRAAGVRQGGHPKLPSVLPSPTFSHEEEWRYT